MKMFQIKLTITAIILGISVATAFKTVNANKTLTTYHWYAVSTGGNNFVWQSSMPSGYTCQSGTATCEISTLSPAQPPANAYPPVYIVISGADHHSVYKMN